MATGWTFCQIGKLAVGELNDFLDYLNANPPLGEQGLDQLLLVGLKLKRGGRTSGSKNQPGSRQSEEDWRKPGIPGVVYSDPHQLAGKLPNCGKVPEFAKSMFKQAEEAIKLAEAAERDQETPSAGPTEPKVGSSPFAPPLTTPFPFPKRPGA